MVSVCYYTYLPTEIKGCRKEIRTEAKTMESAVREERASAPARLRGREWPQKRSERDYGPSVVVGRADASSGLLRDRGAAAAYG